MPHTPEARYSPEETRRRWARIVDVILNDGANDQPEEQQSAQQKAASGH